MDVLCVGHVTYDTTFACNSYPKENSKTRFHEQEQTTGGSLAISAILLAKWNQKVEMAALVGDDEAGRKIKKELSINRVGTKYLKTKEDYKTSYSLVLANRENGERTIFNYVEKNNNLEPLELESAPKYILIDGFEYEASKKLLKKYPNAISIMDADSDKKEVIDLATMVNYLVCSKEFAEKITGIKIDFLNKQTLVDIYLKMEKMFKNKIIITLEKNGVIYRYNDQIKLMPSIKVKTIDSTGVGGVFHGAFIYGLMQKFDYEKVLKYANVAGALSVTRIGSYRSIPTLEEMNGVYGQIK